MECVDDFSPHALHMGLDVSTNYTFELRIVITKDISRFDCLNVVVGMLKIDELKKRPHSIFDIYTFITDEAPKVIGLQCILYIFPLHRDFYLL